jgi:two-component sensor histidine kinase
LSLPILEEIQHVVEAFANRLMTARCAALTDTKNLASVALVKFAAAFESTGFHLDRLPCEVLEEIGKVLHASCVVCRAGDRIVGAENLPPVLIKQLVALVESRWAGRNEVVATDSLVKLDPELAQWRHLAAGMLLLPLDHEHRNFMVFLRPEILQQRQWGGDPTRSPREHDQKLTPRNSFATWIEQVQGRSEPWTLEQLKLARELHTQLLELRSSYLSKVETINQELSKKSRENETLLGEVHHRVKNNLAIVNSIFEWKISETPDPRLAQELREMKGRVRAIASLHQTLYQGQDFGHLNLSRLMRSISNEALLLLKDYRALIRFEIEVPDEVSIEVAEALPIGLIAHEFITNSIKYAFEGRDEGTVTIGWESDADQRVFSLRDNGRGRADIADLKGSSLGLQMMRLLIGQLDANAHWDGRNGVSLKMVLPRKVS